MKSTNQLDSLRAAISERLNAANAINEAMITTACEDPEAPADMGLLDAQAIVLAAVRSEVDRLERLLLTKKSAARKVRAATLNESNAASGGEQPHTIQ